MRIRNMRCSDCKFWKQTPSFREDGTEYYKDVFEDEEGECRRHAPLPVVYPTCDTVQESCDYVNFVVWPQVHANCAGCGDFSGNAGFAMKAYQAMTPEDKNQFKKLIGLP